MKIVIDTNRIIASLIKDSYSRKILSNKNFDFITPEHSISEIYKYENEIREKTKITHEEFELLLSLIFENINIIPKEEYKSFLNQTQSMISDINDVPFIAVCLSKEAEGIWSHNPHFSEQNQIRIFKTQDLTNT